MAFRANKFILETVQSQRTDSRTFGWISYFSFRKIKRDLWGFPKYLGCTLLRTKSDILCRNAESPQPVYKKKSSRRSPCWHRTVDTPGQHSLDTVHAETQTKALSVFCTAPSPRTQVKWLLPADSSPKLLDLTGPTLEIILLVLLGHDGRKSSSTNRDRFTCAQGTVSQRSASICLGMHSLQGGIRGCQDTA